MTNMNVGLVEEINFDVNEAIIRKEAMDEGIIIDLVAGVAEETDEMTRGRIIGGEDSNSGIIIKEGIEITMEEVEEGIMKGVGPQ